MTLFSGFGLGTVLMPVMALFFPLPAAIAMTAVVHFGSNVTKLILLGRRADLYVALRFGVPALAAAFVGSLLLGWLGRLPDVATWSVAGHAFHITAVKLAVAPLIIVFSLVELVPALGSISFGRRWLPLGGLLSGFFGGVSGLQGALRSAFLIKVVREKEAFIATGVVLSCVVDVTRLGVYLWHGEIPARWLLAAAVAAALVGAYTGRLLLRKVTFSLVKAVVGIALLVIGCALAAGLV